MLELDAAVYLHSGFNEPFILQLPLAACISSPILVALIHHNLKARYLELYEADHQPGLAIFTMQPPM